MAEWGSLVSSPLPVWLVAAVIFLLRVTDVALGTMRTIVVVQGRICVAVVLGFFEVLIWITAVSQVILRLHESPYLIVAFAGGFATGNAVGILLERRLALGHCVLRVISREGTGVGRMLASLGQVRGVYRNDDGDPSERLIFVTLARASLAEALGRLKAMDADAFYVVDRFAQTNGHAPPPRPGGWWRRPSWLAPA